MRSQIAAPDVRHALLLVAVSCIFGAATNTLRPRPLPWFAPQPYAVLHECPEVTESAGVIAPEAALQKAGRIVYVDGRSPAEYQREHVDGALNIPYDPLYSIPEEALRRVRAQRGNWLLVYGGATTGKLLADELASSNLRGVLWVQGDLEGLRRAGARIARAAPGGGTS